MRPECSREIPLGACFSIITRGQSIFLNDRLRPFHLSAGQFPVLLLLAKEQNIMQETLVRHYRLDKGTIARAVRKLEDAGYIHRIVDPKNRRAVRIFLTVKGERIIPLLREIDQDWEKRVCTSLAPEERRFLGTLNRVAAKNSIAMMEDSGSCNDASG